MSGIRNSTITPKREDVEVREVQEEEVEEEKIIKRGNRIIGK